MIARTLRMTRQRSMTKTPILNFVTKAFTTKAAEISKATRPTSRRTKCQTLRVSRLMIEKKVAKMLMATRM